ncbi:MAG: hypothetical protein COC03_00800 [Robiginitomaculum sp.]|nr:MAG: hypothetical protein COC03_00800 [Robiginitomaculum sp.]
MESISHLEERYGEITDQQDMIDVLANAISELGFKKYSYLNSSQPGRGISETIEPLFLTNYPDEWRKRYLWKNYHLNDPVSVLGKKSRLPFIWGSDSFLKKFGSDQKIVFYEAREFGVVSGFTIPVHGPNGDCGLFTVASRDTDENFREAIIEYGERLQILGLHAHSLCMTKLARRIKCDEVILTAREKECLLWTAQGKTSAEIASIINRSTPTINYHLQKAMKKLDSVNKYQAVMKAYERNLFH